MILVPMLLMFTMYNTNIITSSDLPQYARKEYVQFSYDIVTSTGTCSWSDGGITNFDAPYVIRSNTLFNFYLYSNSSDDYMLYLDTIHFSNDFYVNDVNIGSIVFDAHPMFEFTGDFVNDFDNWYVMYSVFNNDGSFEFVTRVSDGTIEYNEVISIFPNYDANLDYYINDPVSFFNGDVQFVSDANQQQIMAYLSQIYNTNYQLGYSDGYNYGKSVGLTEGYQTGFDAGFQQADNMDDTALTIFTGIINIALIPINFFLACLNFEVFGINIGGFVSALLTIAIVVIVTRIVISGGNKND